MSTTAVASLDMPTLQAAGRFPQVPFKVRLNIPEAEDLLVTRLFRVFPGRRIVGQATVFGGTLDGSRVLAKLFFDANSARRWKREQEGIVAMLQETIPTPDLLATAALPDGGHVLLTEFLRNSDTLKTLCDLAADKEKPTVLEPAFSLLAFMHLRGLTHNDLHLNNFLRKDSALYLIDGDAVRRHKTPLDPQRIARDLGMLLAQLPRTLDDAIIPLIGAYRMINPNFPSADILQSALASARAWRLRDYMSKTARDCTLFSVNSSFSRFSAVVRKDAKWLAPLLDDPDRYVDYGVALKRGNTATVTKTELGNKAVVVKRYNIKDWLHRLSRMWRPSRGWHAWREGHRLCLYGIPTPTPLAIIEERNGMLRKRAWLITEYCEGMDLSKLDPNAPLLQETTALLALIKALYRTRISHGDMKATNLLWDGNAVQLIDLDAACQHNSDRSFERAWRRDRARLLANWPEDSLLYQWLDDQLPPA